MVCFRQTIALQHFKGCLPLFFLGQFLNNFSTPILHFRKQQQLAPDFTSRFLSKKEQRSPFQFGWTGFFSPRGKIKTSIVETKPENLYSTSNNQTIQYFDNLLGISYPNLTALG